jgi:hypothetical protein
MAKTLAVSATAAANTAVTLTIPAVADKCHYIQSIQITRVATASLAGGAVLDITTTNLGGLNWKVGNAMSAGGTQKDVELALAIPIRSQVANTASTIVFPAPGLAVIWIVNVTYYLDEPWD